MQHIGLLLLIATSLLLGGAKTIGAARFCITNSSDTNCPEECVKYLRNITDYLVSNSTIQFCSGEHVIEDLFVFKNLTNITIVGQGNSVLKCIKSKDTGLKFVHVNRLVIKNLQIEQCSAEHDSTTQYKTDVNKFETFRLSSALYAINCTDIYMHSVHVTKSIGVGVVLYDVGGTVEILHSVFSENVHINGQNDSVFRGGGLYIEFTVCAPGIYCTDYDTKPKNVLTIQNLYIISDSTFEKNKVDFQGPNFFKYTKDRKRLDHLGLGRGGGLSIQLNGNSVNNTFIIHNCTFRLNEAKWGGGIYLVMQDYSSHNSINMTDLTLEENSSEFGGGGVDVGFNIANVINNAVYFKNCQFVQNQAMFGGGVRMYASRKNDSELLNNLQFLKCKWICNVARFGSAIDIAPHVWEILSSGFLPIPLFQDCEFRSNFNVVKKLDMKSKLYTEYVNGKGTMMLTEFKVKFSGLIAFSNNSETALFLSSSTIITMPNTECSFVRNSGFEGGAIAFVGFSALVVVEHNTFHFIKNYATRRGGALYAYPIDKHNFVSSRSCFIQYNGSIDSKEEKHVTFTFTDNFAGKKTECFASGHSIFSPTLLMCIHACNSDSTFQYIRNCPNSGHNDIFNCVGNFTFNGGNMSCQLSTFGRRFDIKEFDPTDEYFVNFFPGREIKLPISLINDFNQTINAVYYAVIENSSSSSIQINHPYTYISNRKIQLLGNPGSTGLLKLQTLGQRGVMLDINVTMLDCPPGYVFDNNTERQTKYSCVCSSYISQESFEPIKECDIVSFRAYLQKGYWFGYQNERFEYELCPSGYCSTSSLLSNNTSFLLPNNTNDLDHTVCGKYRTGRLCGECTTNFSVHYNGINYQCGSNESCDYGWLLYILSELLPVTVLFILATLFNVNFTSGAVNGFIWFAQVIHSLPVTGKSLIVFPNPVSFLYTLTKMVYNVFNFNFFTHDELSFCLWRGATTMDMLVFKFVTVVYVIFLVLFTVALIKYCNIFRKCWCIRYSTLKSSIIHGLSSVLVIVFSQCISVSCQILEVGYIYGGGNVLYETVVYYQANLKLFSGAHIKYALFAILFMSTVTIPTILLLIYPLCFKILNILRCSDTNPVARILFHIPYSRLKPFLDSFQGCFKDQYRVFAGIYFLYRVLIITSTIPKLVEQYLMLDIFLTTFLLIHSITQPYRVHWHNILDSFIFSTLLIINKISWLSYDYIKSTPTDTSNERIILFTTVFLVLIMNIPLFYMITYVIVKLVRKGKDIWKKHTTSNQVDWNEGNDTYEFELTNRDEDSESSIEYKQLKIATN